MGTAAPDPKFQTAMAVVLWHEGASFTDGTSTPIVGKVPKGDPPTKYGVTLPTLRRLRPGATREDVAELTREEALQVYRQLFWNPGGYDQVKDDRSAAKIFDAAVNWGPRPAHEAAQRAASSLGHACAVDGELGPMTAAAVNACEPVDFLLALGREMLAHYDRWIAHDPAEREQCRRGLSDRAAWPFHPQALGLRRPT